MRRGNVKLMKKINRNMIVRIMNNLAPNSRARLTELTGLSPTTISRLMDELLQQELIIEVGQGESSGGRKPLLFDLNPDYSFVFSVEISSGRVVSVGLFNFKSELIDLQEQIFELDNGENVIAGIITGIEMILERQSLAREDVEMMVIGCSGIIDYLKGEIRYSAALKLRNFPLKERLELLLPFPVMVENDTNLAALGEKELGAGQGLDNFLYIKIGSQLGSGIIINHKLYRGHYGAAGEFGHKIIVPDGPVCHCGNRGCLSAVLTDLISIENRDNFIREFTVHQAADTTNYQQFCRYLAVAVTNYLRVIEPEAIVFGGAISEIAQTSFYQQMNELISSYSLQGTFDNPRILSSVAREKAVLLGGTSLYFSKAYGNIDLPNRVIEQE